MNDRTIAMITVALTRYKSTPMSMRLYGDEDINAAILEVEKMHHPSHPAIPDEVREIFNNMINKAEMEIGSYMGAGLKPWQPSPYDKARRWLAQCPTAEAPKPVIQAEARINPTDPNYVALWDAINRFAESCGGKSSKNIGSPARMKAVCEVDNALRSFARAWLAQCSTATDKAVCPECGWEERPMHGWVYCFKCNHHYQVKIYVISPPRAPKVEP